MADQLERPGVRVYQKYIKLNPTIIRPGLPAVIIGLCNQIEEKLQPTENRGGYSGSEQVYTYPNVKLLAEVDSTKTKVYIVTVSGEFQLDATQWEHLTNTTFKIKASIDLEKTITDGIVPSIDGDGKTTTELIDTAQDFFALGVKEGDYVKIDSAEYKILSLTPTTLILQGDVPEASYKAYEVIRKSLTSTGDVFVSYTASRKDNTDYLYELATSDDIENNLGKIHPDNPLAFGAYIALQNTTTTVYALIVATDTLQAYISALEFLETKEVYSIVPLTHNRAVLDACKSHVDQMSAPENKKERIVLWNYPIPEYEEKLVAEESGDISKTDAYGVFTVEDTTVDFTSSIYNIIEDRDVVRFTIGATSYVGVITSIAAHVLTCALESGTISNPVTNVDYSVTAPNYSKFDKARAMKQIGEFYNDKRVVITSPHLVNVTTNGSTADVPGFYLACALGGAIAGNNPAQGLTNYVISGINRVYYSTDYFSEQQSGIIAGGGIMIFEQANITAPVTIRHQLTTAVGAIETRELSIVKAVDFSAKLFRERMKPLIGKYNITSAFINSMCRPYAEGVLVALKEDEVVAPETAIQQLYQHETFSDTIVINIRFLVMYPANYIHIYLLI